LATTEISTSGSASVALAPDVATVRASVETNAPTAGEATSQNNDVYERVVGAVRNLGVNRQDVSLDYYDVSYRSPNEPTGNARTGYTVYRRFSVAVRNIQTAGNVTDACLGAGATSISGVTFGLSDDSTARTQATNRAVVNARAIAETLARAAGLHIFGIKAMQTGGFPEIGPLRTIARVTSSTSTTQMDQSNVNVVVSVGMVFLAKP
jgi:uncharacterized protein YggE